MHPRHIDPTPDFEPLCYPFFVCLIERWLGKSVAPLAALMIHQDGVLVVAKQANHEGDALAAPFLGTFLISALELSGDIGVFVFDGVALLAPRPKSKLQLVVVEERLHS